MVKNRLAVLRWSVLTLGVVALVVALLVSRSRPVPPAKPPFVPSRPDEIPTLQGRDGGPPPNGERGLQSESPKSAMTRSAYLLVTSEGEGVPVPAAVVLALDAGPHRLWRADTSGRVEIKVASSDAAYLVTGADHAAVRLQIPAGAAADAQRPMMVSLRRMETLRGTVLDPAGAPAAGAVVAFVPMEQGMLGWPEPVDGLPGRWAPDFRSRGFRVQTAADGSFSIQKPETNARLRIATSNGIWVPTSPEEASGESRPEDGVFHLVPLVKARVRFVDSETGAPVPVRGIESGGAPQLGLVLPSMLPDPLPKLSPHEDLVIGYIEGTVRTMNIGLRTWPWGYERVTESWSLTWPTNPEDVRTVRVVRIDPQTYGHLTVRLPVDAAWQKLPITVSRATQLLDIEAKRTVLDRVQRDYALSLPAGIYFVSPDLNAMVDTPGGRIAIYNPFPPKKLEVRPGERVEIEPEVSRAGALELAMSYGSGDLPEQFDLYAVDAQARPTISPYQCRPAPDRLEYYLQRSVDLKVRIAASGMEPQTLQLSVVPPARVRAEVAWTRLTANQGR